MLLNTTQTLRNINTHSMCNFYNCPFPITVTVLPVLLNTTQSLRNINTHTMCNFYTALLSELYQLVLLNTTQTLSNIKL